jgi:hypothetical protein
MAWAYYLVWRVLTWDELSYIFLALQGMRLDGLPWPASFLGGQGLHKLAGLALPGLAWTGLG